MRLPMTRTLLTASPIALFLLTASSAIAHPHVWVSVETTVVYESGTIKALRQRWYFDEIYSAMAAQGLDANGDGEYDRSELAELLNVKIEGLRQFNHFTFATLSGQDLSFDPPTDWHLEYVETANPPLQSLTSDPPAGSPPAESSSFWSRLTNALTGATATPEKTKVLALQFTLPLSKPVLAEAEGFSFSTYDPSFFIWFDLAQEQPIKLVNAPAGCTAEIIKPVQDTAQFQQLGEAAFKQNSVQISFAFSKRVTLSCRG